MTRLLCYLSFGAFWAQVLVKYDRSTRRKTFHPRIVEIFEYKEYGNLVKISTNEAIELHKRYGIPYGNNGISVTHSHHKACYLCESRYNLDKLRKLRPIAKSEI